MKGISTVIASILMLLIVIGLGGTAYLYISGVFTSKTSTTFEIIDSVNDSVTIRNSGTGAITSFSTATIDGNSAVYRVSTQDPSLVGYWKMDENSWLNDCSTKSIIDSSNKGNGGKACPVGTGPTGGAIGQFGNGGSFDGTNDGVTVDHTSSLNFGSGDFSISFWVKTTNTINGDSAMLNKRALYATGAGWHLEMDQSSQNVGWRMGGTITNFDQSTTAVNLRDGAWHHLVYVFNRNGNAQLFIDNILKINVPMPNIGSVDNSVNMGIGFSAAQNARFFAGAIDEFKIFNRALSAQEVSAHYNIGSQLNSGEVGTIKVYNILLKGTHTLRLCTSSMCNIAILTIQ